MTEAVASEGPSQEPTIEEILASIRRIISDDGTEGAAEGEAAADAAPAEDEILELTERVDEPAPRMAVVNRTEDNGMSGLKSELEGDNLVSEPAAQHSAEFLSRLTPREAERTNDPLPIAPRTLEEVVREMLRPMLREWLDAYLPGIVERAVDREMRRVGRRAEELH